MSVERFFAKYQDNGFKFSKEILSRYALSLATKPFVILSGISGTGKTKIAQLFEVPQHVEENAGNTTAERGYIPLRVTEGMCTGDGRANLKMEDLPLIISQEELDVLNEQVREMRENGQGGNIGEEIPLTIIGLNGEELSMGLYLQRASSPLVRLRAKSKRGSDVEYDNRDYFESNFQVGDVLRLEAEEPRRLRIAAVNEDEVIRESRTERAAELTSIKNTCFIPVKSNWIDSSELLGYYNQITDKYMVSKFLHFLLKAKENPEKPFFVILDEMNLSKVEHYFSDFLSCIESRVFIDGEIKQQKISLFHGQEFIETNDEEYDEIESEVEIPLNLYVTGTVNIDDSTYMFSPKVLDRANVIEFNEVVLDDEDTGNDEGGFVLENFPNFSDLVLPSLSHYNELASETKTKLKIILESLKEYNLHFGYRTIAEISLFIVNSKNNISDENSVELKALDIQVLQKILPKFNGSFAKLNEPLRALVKVLSNTEKDIEEVNYQLIEQIDPNGSEFPRSLAKIKRMYKNLSEQGFAGFIE